MIFLSKGQPAEFFHRLALISWNNLFFSAEPHQHGFGLCVGSGLSGEEGAINAAQVGNSLTSPVHFALRYFDPRPPCGGRLCASSSALTAQTISTHAPLAGGDVIPPPLNIRTNIHFNQRPPCGGRLSPLTITTFTVDFNQRPPCGGRLTA